MSEFDDVNTQQQDPCLRGLRNTAMEIKGIAHIVHAPQQDDWAPGYYSLLFEDCEGIRIEANFVPGKGLLLD